MKRSLEEAVQLLDAGLAIVGARSGGSGNGTDDGRITPLGLIASAYVCETLRSAAETLFMEECPPSPSFNPESPSGHTRIVDATGELLLDGIVQVSDEELEEAVQLGKMLTKPVRDLVSLFEDVSAGVQPVSARRGVLFILDRGDGEREKDGEESDALSDAVSILQSISLYRRVTEAAMSSSSPTSPVSGSESAAPSPESEPSSAGPSTPTELGSYINGNDEDALSGDIELFKSKVSPSHTEKRTNGKVSVGTRLALRRMLGSSVFLASSQMNDARDRMVDYLVDTEW
jgi:hypothetical protein